MEVEVLQISLWKPQRSFFDDNSSPLLLSWQTATGTFSQNWVLLRHFLLGHGEFLILSILATLPGQDICDTSMVNVELCLGTLHHPDGVWARGYKIFN